MSNEPQSRRGFLAALAGALAATVVPDGVAGLNRWPGTGHHPEPRPGIDGSRVLPANRLGAQLGELFDGVRRIPHVVDGIRCHCGCAEVPGMYSLLSCYEDAGMAQYCNVCQGEGRLVLRLHDEGRTLDEIRTAVDRRFG